MWNPHKQHLTNVPVGDTGVTHVIGLFSNTCSLFYHTDGQAKQIEGTKLLRPPPISG
jgi:hypothetical protein